MRGNLKRLGKIAYFIIGIFVILGLSYFFGYPLLEGLLKGNDAPFNLLYIQWLDSWFPKIPFWFPLQGGGASLASGYPLGAHLSVILLAKLSPLDLVQAMRLLAFASFPLVSFGIFVFVWYKFKNTLAAFLAGVFYLLSYASWPWLTDLGLYAQPISLIFVPWVFLFFDQFLSQKKAPSFLLGTFFFTLAGLFHFITAIILLEALFLYAIFFERNFLTALRTYLIFAVGSLALSLFWLIPMVSYRMYLGREPFIFPGAEQVRHIPISVLFGLKGINILNENSLIWYVYFAYPVTILAFLGVILAFIKREKEKLFVGLLALIFIFQTAFPGIAPGIVKPLIALFGTVQERSVIIAMIFLPIAASLGCFLIADKLLFFLKQEGEARKSISNLLALVLTFLLIFGFLGRVPANSSRRLTAGYKGYGPDWGIKGKLLIPPAISKQGISLEEWIKELVSRVGGDEFTRIDISPSLGYEMQAWNLFSQNSQVRIYEGMSALSHALLGYQWKAFYKKEEVVLTEEINNLAKYFGIRYALLNSGTDPLERFARESWEDVHAQEHIVVKKFTKPEELVTLTYKPTTLVIGRLDKSAYEQIFRAANLGSIPYELALLVEGEDNGLIDGYTFEELKQFNALLLYGYTYKDRLKAMKLLEDYVATGGKLFIETGWQYVSPDWQRTQTEAIFPVDRFHWTNFGKSWSLEGFSPPIYKGEPWGVGAADLEDMRSWAEPVVVEGNKVLVAKGNFGKGKVVWSGMNLWGHALTYRNEEEIRQINSLVSWLLEETQGQEIGGVVIKRESPDRIEFSFTIPIEGLVSLYFRESYHPYWKAYIQKTEDGRQKTINLPIYRAGPEYMWVRLPPLKTDAKVVFEIRKPFFFVVAKLASLFTLIFLLIWAVKPEILSQFISKIPKQKFLFKDFSVMTKWWDREEE